MRLSLIIMVLCLSPVASATVIINESISGEVLRSSLGTPLINITDDVFCERFDVELNSISLLNCIVSVDGLNYSVDSYVVSSGESKTSRDMIVIASSSSSSVTGGRLLNATERSMVDSDDSIIIDDNSYDEKLILLAGSALLFAARVVYEVSG